MGSHGLPHTRGRAWIRVNNGPINSSLRWTYTDAHGRPDRVRRFRVQIPRGAPDGMGCPPGVRHLPRPTNWAGNVAFGAARLHKPESIHDLRRIVHDGRLIRALGCGHSFSRIADTAGDLVLLDALPRTLHIDWATSTVTVSSRTTYTELAVELDRAGFALANLASIPHISIAGACATGTHGSGDDLSVLAASVAAIQLVVADGEHVELRRDVDGDAFRGSVVALGALGVVTHLTLDIEPAYEMSQRVHLDVPLEELEERLDGVFRAGYSVSAFTDWHSGRAIVWIKRRMDLPAPKWTAGRPAQHAVHPVPGRSPELCTEQLGVVGRWHERLTHFRSAPNLGPGNELQSEIFLPRPAAKQAVAALREIASLLAPALLVSEIRTVRSDDLWLSPAYGRDSVAFHFTWTADESAVLPALGAVEERLISLGPRPHWGKITSMSPRQIITGYRARSRFRTVDGRLRPNLQVSQRFRE